MEIFLYSAPFRATVSSSYFSLLHASFQHFCQSTSFFPPTWTSDTILQELMRAKKWVQLKHSTLSSWCIFQQKFGRFSLRIMEKEKENGMGRQSYTMPLDLGSRDMSWPVSTLMLLKKWSTLSTWIKDTGRFSPWIKSGTFQHSRRFYSKSQKYREIVCTSFVYLSAMKYL